MLTVLELQDLKFENICKRIRHSLGLMHLAIGYYAYNRENTSLGPITMDLGPLQHAMQEIPIPLSHQEDTRWLICTTGQTCFQPIRTTGIRLEVCGMGVGECWSMIAETLELLLDFKKKAEDSFSLRKGIIEGPELRVRAERQVSQQASRRVSRSHRECSRCTLWSQCG